MSRDICVRSRERCVYNHYGVLGCEVSKFQGQQSSLAANSSRRNNLFYNSSQRKWR